MGTCFLGMDYGTGGAKVTVINCEGEILGYAFEEYPIYHQYSGWSEHDPALYWDIACRLIPKTLQEAGAHPKDIKGIAISSAGPSMVMVDAGLRPIHRAYNLMDRRATVQVQWLKDHIGEERIFTVSGNRLDDHPSLVNLMWERENRRESFVRIHKALTIDGFITLKLTGKAVCHYSGAAFYGVAYNILGRFFDQDLLDRIGIAPEILPELHACEDIVGEVTSRAALETGLAAGTPVASGQIDCNASWVGAGAIHEGDIQMNLGTVGNFGIIHKDANFLQSMIAFAYTTDSKTTYITVPTTTTGGQLIRYMRDNFYQREREAEKAGGTDTFDLINQEAERVPPGSDGLLILPFLMGERTPIWDVNARGVIFGLSLNHTRGHIIRAMMEAVGYALYDSFRLIGETGRKMNYPIVLNEGGAKSVLWRRIITDIFNTPTVLVKRRTGAPFGDAILAGVATGYLKDFSVAKEWTQYVERMEPDRQNHLEYMEYFQLFKDLYHHVKEDYLTLSQLRNRKL